MGAKHANRCDTHLLRLTAHRNRFTLYPMEPPIQLPQIAAAELRAEMARQLKTVTHLADALGLERQAAKLRYDGKKSLTLDEVEMIALWLKVDVEQLLRGRQAVAS